VTKTAWWRGFGLIVIIACIILLWRVLFPAGGPVVQVSVSVADAGVVGGSLSFRWKSTDGHIVDVDQPETTWTLPAGPGLHFAYVLVSNGQGGFTERRVAVITDTIGAPIVVPWWRRSYSPPLARPPEGNSYRSFLNLGMGELPELIPGTGAVQYRAFVPDALVYLRNSATGRTFPPGGATTPVKTDLRGQFVIHDVLETASTGSINSVVCSADGGATWDDCGSRQMPGIARTAYRGDGFFDGFDPAGPTPVVGRFRLSDDSTCGTVNKFFGVEATGTATLLDASGVSLSGPVRLSADGDYSFRDKPGSAQVQVTCGAASAVLVPVGTAVNSYGAIDTGFTTLSGVRAPIVDGMTATLAGASVGVFLPPPLGPSDAVPDANRFFTYKGDDSRIAACQYYRAIGAVRGCDANGNFSGAINVEDWKRAVKIGAYAAPGTSEYAATFINKVDLNLTRNHHSISYGPNNTAAYVCNHLGPPSLDASQTEIDTAIDNAVAGKNLVACVMMDHRASEGVNDRRPFTRFLIFGPSGELLPSINLDGRREKFVPGVCVACHGGDKYVGFPEDGTGAADIGAHFLPYDVGNFSFSSKPGRTRADQEVAIYNLNQNVLKAGPTPAAQALVTGWYPGGTTLQNTNYLPPSWAGRGFDDVYHKVYAHSCRTCHVNMPGDEYDFDTFDNVGYTIALFGANLATCQHVTHSDTRRKWSMPNSLVTFNRFWGTKGTSDDLTDLFAAFVSTSPSVNLGTPPKCTLVHVP
jgi:hypothetical protein